MGTPQHQLLTTHLDIFRPSELKDKLKGLLLGPTPHLQKEAMEILNKLEQAYIQVPTMNFDTARKNVKSIDIMPEQLIRANCFFVIFFGIFAHEPTKNQYASAGPIGMTWAFPSFYKVLEEKFVAVAKLNEKYEITKFVFALAKHYLQNVDYHGEFRIKYGYLPRFATIALPANRKRYSMDLV